MDWVNTVNWVHLSSACVGDEFDSLVYCFHLFLGNFFIFPPIFLRVTVRGLGE